jgi:hypothetical protein
VGLFPRFKTMNPFKRKKKESIKYIEKECLDCEEIKSMPENETMCYDCWVAGNERAFGE